MKNKYKVMLYAKQNSQRLDNMSKTQSLMRDDKKIIGHMAQPRH